MGPGNAEFLANGMNEERARLDFQLAPGSIDDQSNFEFAHARTMLDFYGLGLDGHQPLWPHASTTTDMSQD
jgi:hypothetical protein